MSILLPEIDVLILQFLDQNYIRLIYVNKYYHDLISKRYCNELIEYRKRNKIVRLSVFIGIIIYLYVKMKRHKNLNKDDMYNIVLSNKYFNCSDYLNYSNYPNYPNYISTDDIKKYIQDTDIKFD